MTDASRAPNEEGTAPSPGAACASQSSPPEGAEARTLLRDVLVFARHWNLTDTQFGLLAVHSTQFVSSLRKGRKCRPATEQRVRDFMAAGDPRDGLPGLHGAARSRETIRRNARTKAHDEYFRATDEAERAKKFIRIQGWHCFDAAILKPAEHGKFYIGPRLVTRAQLLDFARRKGWQG